MVLVEILVIAGILVAVAVVATGRGDAMDDAPPLEPVLLPPDRPVQAGDLEGLRFPLALRGYRMADVDAALARIADRMAELEDEIEQMRSSPGAAALRQSGHPPLPPPPPPPPYTPSQSAES